MNHLSQFKKLFNPEKCKELPGRLEIRGANLDLDMAEARKIINENNLDLVAETNDMLITYRAFEVKQL